MSGALMCLSLVFSSCGNVDNPLEEIGNSNPVVAQLKDALADGAVITITFNLNGEQTITFKKGEDGYKFDGAEADNMRYHLEYDDENGLLVLDVRGEEASPASQIILNPKDNSFYIINNFGYNTTSNGKFSVNGVEGTLTNSCPDKAIIETFYGGDARALTRATELPSLIVYYNKKNGETWKDVIDRYKNSLFNNLFGIGQYDEELEIILVSYDDYAGHLLYEMPANIENCVHPADKVGLKAGADFAGPYVAKLVYSPLEQ